MTEAKAAAAAESAAAPGRGQLPQPLGARNPGMDLDLALVRSIQANSPAIERRAKSLAGRRTVKREWQAAWLLKAITLIDLTTLSGDDTGSRVDRLCRKARDPVRRDILEALGMAGRRVSAGAVCVYHDMVGQAVESLAGSGIPVAAVSTGFPAGLSPRRLRIEEIHDSVQAGASEIDIVISRRLALSGDWKGLYSEVREFRAACGDARMKAILGTGDLATLRSAARASAVCMMAGADFVKTSTGKESVNATLPVSLAMIRQVRSYHEMTGHLVGFKPAGGISAAKEALAWMLLIHDELGRRWLEPDLFRFGASSLLGDIERQLEHCAAGDYSAARRHAMG